MHSQKKRSGQTIIELLWVILILIGLVLMGIYGAKQWGWVGAIAGVIIGGTVGYYFGWFLLWSISVIFTWSNKRKAT
jgi:hypothetical protein